MRKQILTLGLLLALPLLGYGAEPRPREIVVSGDAIMLVPSDRVTISATISTVQKNYKNAVNEVEGKLKNAVEAIRKLGVADKAVSYADLRANPHYEYTEKGSKLTGFEVTRSLTIQLDSLDMLGSVFEMLLASNVTAVDGPNYEFKERDAVYRQALSAAAAEADAKAQALATARGLSGLRLVRLEENGAVDYIPQTNERYMRASESVEMAKPAFSNNLSVIGAQVRAVYEFAQ